MFGGVKRNVTVCKALVCRLSSPSNICCCCVCVCVCVSMRAEHLTDENFTLLLCTTELCRFKPMHLIKQLIK